MVAVVVGGGGEAAAGVPPLEHGPEPVELAGHEFRVPNGTGEVGRRAREVRKEE